MPLRCSPKVEFFLDCLHNGISSNKYRAFLRANLLVLLCPTSHLRAVTSVCLQSLFPSILTQLYEPCMHIFGAVLLVSINYEESF